MAHELFTIERKPSLTVTELSTAQSLRDRLKVVTELGLIAQAEAIKKEIASIERGALISKPPLTEDEITIWQAWLPRRYTEISNDGFTNLSAYNFDRIPSPVLGMWQRCKKADLFQSYEIWTAEDDPALIGINGNTTHLLARWGESDANLVAFDDIKTLVMRRMWRDWYSRRWIEDAGFVWGFIGGFACALLFLVAADKIGVSPPYAWSMAALGFIVGNIATPLFVYRHEKKKDPVVHAIERHNQTTPAT